MLTNKLLLILASIGLFQGTFISSYLFTLKNGNKKLNIYLAFILLGLTLRIGKSVLGYYSPLEAWQKNIGLSGIFIVGPLLWFYGIILIQKNKNLPSSYYLHLFPFILFVLLIPIIPSNGDFENFWNYGLVVFHLAIYLLFSWLTVIKQRANYHLPKFKWYRNILIGVTVIWVYYLSNFLNLGIHYIWGPIFYSLLIYAFTYVFLNRTDFYLEKYEYSNLDVNSSRTLFTRIKNLFEDERLFLEPNITIKNIAEKLSENSREVSQAINENTQQNFREFVNYYRIERAKALLIKAENKHHKMATVAYDAGFGTVTAFNVAFKKNTGLTPSAFRKKNISN